MQSLFALFFGEGTDDENIVLTALHEARFKRKAQARVDDDAHEGTPSRQAAAVGEQGIVGDDCSDANHDCIILMAQLLNVSTRDFAGDPAAADRGDAERGWVLGRTGRWSDFSVESHCRLQRNQRLAATNVIGEGVVDTHAFYGQKAGSDDHACPAKPCETLSGDERVGVDDPRDHPANARGDERVCAWSGAPLMRAWLEIDVEGGGAGFAAGLFEGPDLGMFHALVGM